MVWIVEDSLTTPVAQETRLLIALLLVTLPIALRFAKRLKPVEGFVRRFLWGNALLDFVLYPAAAYGAGQLVQWLLQRLGQTEWSAAVAEVTQLLIYLAVASGCARLVEVWVLTKEPDGEEVRLSQLSRSVLYGLALFIGLLAFFAANDYAPTELYVSTGALAAVLAFAMQQTLGDLFSGIALSIERPFKIGDWLRFSDGKEGEVTDINWRATRLRGWDNTTYVVPNGQLSRESFTNLHGKDHPFSPWYLVRVSGEADPQEVIGLLREAAARCRTIPAFPAPVARLMDGTTIPYTYMVWVHFPNYPSMFAGREELYREIHYGLKGAGLQIAAEIQEIRHRAVAPKAADARGTPPA